MENVRLSYSNTNKDGIIQPRQYNNPSCTGGTGPFDPPMCIDNWKPGEIVEVNSYYPFGLMHNYTVTTQNAYQYKYNGKELQETGMYDYGARFYMPDIGRWGVSDPLAEALRRHTPYNYGVNNPVVFVDPDGRLSQSFIDAMMGSSGTYYNTGNGFSNGSDSFGFNGRGFASQSMSANFSFDSQISSFNELMGGLGGENSLSPWMQNYLDGNDFTDCCPGENDLLKGVVNGAIGTLEDSFGLVGLGIKMIGGKEDLIPRLSTKDKTAELTGILLFAAMEPTPGGEISAGGKELKSIIKVISKEDFSRIQNAATRIKKPITVVGSRANGTAKAYSDWDYVIEGLNSREWSKIKNSIPGAKSLLDNTPRNIDIFKRLDKSRPYITIYPR